MPGTPPPYAGELCRNAEDGGEHDLDIARLGRYYGLCGVCRPKAAQQTRERRSARETPRGTAGDRDLDGLRDEVLARSKPRRTLKVALEELVGAGERLQQAIDDRDAAAMHARVAVGEFKEALNVVGRAAQSLLNTSPSRNGSH